MSFLSLIEHHLVIQKKILSKNHTYKSNKESA